MAKRRRKRRTKLEIKAERLLREWGEERIRKEVLECFYGPKVLPSDLAQQHVGYKAWIQWARKQIDLNQNATKSK